LAENRPSYNLDLYIEELRPAFDEMFTLARAGRKLTRAQRNDLRTRVRFAAISNAVQRAAQLAQQPLQLTERQFRRHHDQWPYRPLPVLQNLTPQQTAQVLEQSVGVAGLELEVQPVRHYLLGADLAHHLGYLSRADLVTDPEESGCNYSLPSYQGAVGLEWALEKELSGAAGIKQVVVNSLCYREAESIWIAPTPGRNAVLTIDAQIQKAAAAALRSAGPNTRGAIVVMDPQNGDLLALASAPAYDPNEFVWPISEERWRELNDPKLRPMFNRATQGTYPPGSVFKVITALACLESGVLHSANLTSQLNNPGYYQLGRRRIRDTAAPGDYDFRRAFKRSSNTYFITYGLKAGRERILELGRHFSLGQRTGVPTRQDAGGYFPRPEEVRWLWNEGNTANLCIGQEITVTPLQVAVMTAAIANGGKVLRPRFVFRTEPPEPGLDENGTNYFAPQLRGEVPVKAENLEIVRAAMLADVEDPEGTGRAAKVPGLDVCGKTGTAQIQRGGVVVEHITWFASFAPYANPRYVVVVMVEGGVSGTVTCAPLARRVYEAVADRTRPEKPASVKLARSE
jgi:penicillin-binding protein 2